jgi:hypothetical protein
LAVAVTVTGAPAVCVAGLAVTVKEEVAAGTTAADVLPEMLDGDPVAVMARVPARWNIALKVKTPPPEPVRLLESEPAEGEKLRVTAPL